MLPLLEQGLFSTPNQGHVSTALLTRKETRERFSLGIINFQCLHEGEKNLGRGKDCQQMHQYQLRMSSLREPNELMKHSWEMKYGLVLVNLVLFFIKIVEIYHQIVRRQALGLTETFGGSFVLTSHCWY
ncbi:unnamed protein product [Leuciscus chuanchicus]